LSARVSTQQATRGGAVRRDLRTMTARSEGPDVSHQERPRRRPSRFVRRARTHAAIAAGSVVATALMFASVKSDDAVFKASMATAYVALALFAITLAFGPAAALRHRRYPVSTDIRRDFGIWSGIFALVHVAVGLQVHMRGKMWEYFAHASGGSVLPRLDPFGLANYAGLAATVIFAALLVTSNDMSLRRLGASGWQRIHGLTNWALTLTALHGVAYQWIEKRPWAFVFLFAALALLSIGPRLSRSRRVARPIED
jgi:sulfoxide reductase heme-binding subunit YedZ